MSVFSLVQAFQCLTFNKNLSCYNFFLYMCLLYIFPSSRFSKKKVSFFALSSVLKSFPLILSLLKSHIQIFLFRNIMPPCSSGGLMVGLAMESRKQQLFSCMLLSWHTQKTFSFLQRKLLFAIFRHLNQQPYNESVTMVHRLGK